MSEASPVRRFFGGALMAVGFLIMALCGLCSACGFVLALTDDAMKGGDTIALVLVFGGVPFAIGLGIFFAGKALRGTPPERPTLPPANFRGDDTP
jgi:hypothetical protein